jgi:hypothetical protein
MPVTDPAAPKRVKPIETNLREELQLYYDIRDGSYVSLLNGRFVGMNKADLQIRFKALGSRDDNYIPTKTMGSLREIDYPFFAAQNERMIDFAGPVAGRRTGVFEDSAGRKFLVTDEANGVWEQLVPKANPKLFREFVEELLPGDQSDAFCFWLSEAVRSMRAVDFSPGQVCFFVGEGGCGKSLLQYFVTEILGGRSANPFEYLMGEKFNKDLVGAEHWMFEDPKNSTDIRTRRDFGEGLKESTVNRDIRVRAMCKDATMIQIFRRVTCSVNSEKESIAVIPPMVAGLKDKINLFLCAAAQKTLAPFRDANGKVERAKLWAAFKPEVHAIRSWLLKNFAKIPASCSDERFGVAAYHHPEILAELSSMTYESRFLELIDEVEFKEEKDFVLAPIERRSSDWQKILMDYNKFESEKIFRYPGQCGSHLSKLAKSHPQRVSKRVLDGNTLWKINPPSKGK